VVDGGPDAGAAHSDELGLQAVVVSVAGLGALHLPQVQRLEPDGLGLQAAVLGALGVQAALQGALGLRHVVRHAILIEGGATDRERERGRRGD